MKILAERLEKHSERKDHNWPGPKAQGQRGRSHYPPAVKHSCTLICQTDSADLRRTRRFLCAYPISPPRLSPPRPTPAPFHPKPMRPGLTKIACTLGQLFNLKHILSY